MARIAESPRLVARRFGRGTAQQGDQRRDIAAIRIFACAQHPLDHAALQARFTGVLDEAIAHRLNRLDECGMHGRRQPCFFKQSEQSRADTVVNERRDAAKRHATQLGQRFFEQRDIARQ